MLRRGKAARTDIPAGAPSDWSQVFEGEGHAVPGGTAGDVVVKLEVRQHRPLAHTGGQGRELTRGSPLPVAGGAAPQLHAGCPGLA